ncbi:hypothetical protein BJY01DRAFT_246773 [Aspergillus pseudoustus]|uniref:Frag1/DRAM/Sfk1 family-domain-containing protein n=1 Tax=Aspergillus pseudoustus TaxID=1810923 RepID=A0ABR4K5F6_9EURO
MEEGWDFDAAPAEFKQVQPFLLGLLAVSGTGWLINYFTTIRTAFRDRTPGVSLIALSNNLAWECVFAIFHPPPLPIATIIVRAWLLVDIFVIYTTVKFARAASGTSNEANAPLLNRYLPLFVLGGILGFFSGHWALSVLLGPLRAFYWSGMVCLVMMSGTALGLLVQRGHTRGSSYGMWLSRFIASIFAVASLFLRSAYWPQVWAWSDNIVMRWLSGAFFVLDNLYGVCFWYTRQFEKQSRREKLA